MRTIFFTCCLAFTLLCGAQYDSLTLNFEDASLGNWNAKNIGRWGLDSLNPLCGEYSMSHIFDSPESATDYIYYIHQPTRGHSIGWKFSVRYGVSPSANNYWTAVLGNNASDVDNLPENTIIVGVNWHGNDDLLKIWQQHNNSFEVVSQTGLNWEEHLEPDTPVSIQINIDESGRITVQADTGNSNLASAEGWLNQTPAQVNTFGLFYKYSSSHDRKLSVDDILVRSNFLRDVEPPQIQGVQVISERMLEVKLSEPAKIPSPVEFCVPLVGCAEVESQYSSRIRLRLPAPLQPGRQYTLELPGLSDFYGNTSNPESQIIYYPSVYDIVISEIMADPSPLVMLPEVEYIELYNNSAYLINLSGWTLKSNGRQCKLPEVQMEQGEYIVLCEKENTGLFNAPIPVAGVSGFPAIGNSGTLLALQDASGKLIHSIDFTPTFYDIPGSDDGGWAAEMISPEYPCVEEGNWAVSRNASGGTPGSPNSVTGFPDFVFPSELWRVSATSENRVRLYFSIPLDSVQSSSSRFYSLKPGSENPSGTRLSWPKADRLDLEFDRNFEKDKKYSVSMTLDPTDCTGALPTVRNGEFMLPSPPAFGSVVINEIMPDPVEGNSEYLELYNPTHEAFEIKGWKLVTDNDTSEAVSNEYFLLMPESYAIIAETYTGIEHSGYYDLPHKLMQMERMPALRNAGGPIKLLDSLDNLIDAVYYDPDWHHQLIASTDGVALERVSAFQSGMEPENWHTASSDVNYQTPGRRNSQAEVDDKTNQITVSTESVTPNADGVDDVLEICYRLNHAGYMGRVMIFNKSGQLAKTLVNGELLAIENCLEYTGDSDSGAELSGGIYILFFEAFDDKGNRFVQKKSFVLAREQ